MRLRFSHAAALLVLACSWERTAAEDWRQFRGAHGGAAVPDLKLPTEIGPEQNLLWKTPLPPGHSSPIVVGDRIYVTGVRGDKLVTIGMARATGEILWERIAPYEKLEEIYSIGSHAQPTPAADADHVVSMFGSCGLFCYSRDGEPLWHVPMGPFKNEFGAGASPQIVDGKVILNQDHDEESFLAAFDVKTGAPLWRTDRAEFPRNYATPAVWTVGGRKQIVVPATLRICGYDLETGKEIWTVRGVSRIVNMSPTVGPDNVLYCPCWSPGGDPDDRIKADPWAAVAAAFDKNSNGTLEKDELPNGPIKQRYNQIDRDKNGQITMQEYESMRTVFEKAQNVMLAIRPGGEGEITDTHVLWKYSKLLPYCPSPVLYKGNFFMVKNGGVVSCLDAATGQPHKQGRVNATGEYYSSPVAGDGKVFLLDRDGKLTVLSADPQWEILHEADFAEDCYATPAVLDGRLYLRTAGHLYCFGTR